MQEAERCGIHRTLHAGVDGPASNIKDAIELLKAERIGHGYSVLQDEGIYQVGEYFRVSGGRCVGYYLCFVGSQWSWVSGRPVAGVKCVVCT